MKKKILALFLSVHLLLSVMTPSFYATADWFKSSNINSVEEEEELSVSGPSVTVTSIFPECTLEWTSFSDYIFKQASTAWNYPETYVGYEVEFFPYWTSIECVSGFTGNEKHVWLGIKPGETKSNTQIDPSEFKMVIDGYYFEEESQYLWYKVKAAEGYVLPEVLEQNPYVLHLDPYALQNRIPAFIIGPVKAIFNSTTGSVNVKEQSGATSNLDTVDLSLLSPIFDVMPVYQNSQYTNHYDIGDLAAEYTEYRYVEEGSITILPAEVSVAYEKLVAAEDTYEYYEIMREIPEEILAQFSEQHRTALDECIAALEALEQVRYKTTVDFGGIMLPIVVVGKLPDNVELQASVVPNATVFAEGFDVKEDFSDIIAALDIKLVYTADGTEWQPKEGRRVGVSIGLGALGYEEGAVVRLQHKHDDFIDDYKIAIVQDEFLTVYTSGFSIYAVTELEEPANNATAITNGSTVTLEIAKNTNNEYIFYFKAATNNTGPGGGIGGNRPGGNNNTTPSQGTWTVKDPTGALHYTVHSSTTAVGNGGVYAPWIKVHPLKVMSVNDVEKRVELSFSYYRNNNVTVETYPIDIITPKGGDNGRDYKLYIKDDVNERGKITAALVDKDGKEIENGLDGAAFEWSRSDNYLINTTAYDDDYRSVNIALDHSGLVEARKTTDGKGFQPTTYTLKATLSDGEDYYAYYTVYYQSEIINADFEFPTTSTSNYYAYFPNGWPELHWKTTVPGSGSKLTMDIEYGFPEMTNEFGVTQAASGSKIAEINAEAFGALYQDVISVPGEEIVWNFSHAPRTASFTSNISNAMFIVLGPTEAAQKLKAEDLEQLGKDAKTAASGVAGFLDGTASVEVTYNGAKYTVWYHDAGTYTYGGQNDVYEAENNYGWTHLEGSYIAPSNQYRTRLFFMSEKKAGSNNDNANTGNLIDQARGGQYRKYVIEYWSEVLQGDNQLQKTLLKEVKGEALLHSSVKLEDLATYMNHATHPYYLHKILINGGNYPYNVRYEGDASLYVEKYEPVSNFFDDPKYADYDIVMLVYLRDVASTVQVQLNFPEKMTEAQKLSVIEALKGYQTTVEVLRDGQALDVGVATITKRDPKGNYTAYYYFKDDIYLTKGTTYNIVQTALPDTDKLGLELKKSGGTVYYTYYYENGAVAETASDEKDADILLNGSRGFAEVVIVNTYIEKTTTIYYKGVGNGKVAFANVENDGNLDFVDTPTEELAFYSGQAIGAKVFPGEGATFVGWFTDEACTKPVTPADGVVGADNSFKPNANIINADKKTFYAKFETGSVVIERKNAKPGQTFVYCIENSSNNLKMYVTLQCDANGSGTVAILEAATVGTYTVTELNDWSWRHDGEKQSGQHQGDEKELKFTFTGEVKKKNWLNGFVDFFSNTH